MKKGGFSMFPDKFFEVLKHEGVVSITSWSDNEAHVTNTWNSYLKIKDDTIFIPRRRYSQLHQRRSYL